MEILWTVLNTFFMMYGVFWLWQTLTNSDDDLEQQIHTDVENALILCKVEQIKDTYYLYNAQNEEFVGQGKDICDFTEISERLQKHIMIVEGEEEVIEKLQSKVRNEISIG